MALWPDCDEQQRHNLGNFQPGAAGIVPGATPNLGVALSTIDVKMTNQSGAVAQPSPIRNLTTSSMAVGGVVMLVVGACVVAAIFFFATYDNGTVYHATAPVTNGQYPIGIANASEPSGFAPTAPNALTGYSMSYVSDFEGSAIPIGWNVFTGVPGGDPGGQFGMAHVVVANGMLQLNAWRDPQYKNKWVTGGLCQCGLKKVYGAYFVRSRVTGAGPTEVELLWPFNNKWPPEIDFNESAGSVTSSTSTIHWSPVDNIEQSHISINMKQWHTWGLVWTATAVTYFVDGQVWGRVTNPNEITKTPMTLNLEQIALCSSHRECPTRPVSMQVDWVTEYTSK